MYPVYREPPRPIPASSASRSKLNAFRYQNTKENEAEAMPEDVSPKKGHGNKENQTSWINGVVEPDEPSSNREQHPQEADTKPVKDCPQTPGNRLPLADLIGNAEDAFSRAPVRQEFTPEDYVIWQHVPPSSNPSTQTPATQSKKRRHSSSPGSSPLAGSKRAQKGSFDLQAFQAVLKTPQNDLATDLWNNYVAKTTTNVTDLQQPRFANLLSSSPHTPISARSAQDSSGLRRSISCNAEWPSSKAKKRKTDGESHPTGRAIFSRTRSHLNVPKDYKASNFSSLVKEMEKSLQRVAPNLPDPSKPAPIQVSNKVRRSRSASPLTAKVANAPVEELALGGDMIELPRDFSNDKPLQESSSDFGDDDLDDDFLELADASIDPFVEPVRSQSSFLKPSAEHQHAFPADEADHSFNKDYHLPSHSNEKPQVKSAEVDEFDDDFEEFSDNIEDILAGCDETPSNKLPRVMQQPKIINEPQNDTKDKYTTSSDEFDDDDFDLDCLDQPMPQGEDSLDDVGLS
ncbi:hypothetical protein BJY04DRAFT_188309 [Aspergillus karnatakaensis]|uniref:bifunctional ATP-dependent DNA helicase/ssDNA endodeoxyribonuclease DNA2 n=1 Tax=Aspergillus karnatakaensis TaxID=1810916 RepID=UPI003CCD8ADB